MVFDSLAAGSTAAKTDSTAAGGGELTAGGVIASIHPSERGALATDASSAPHEVQAKRPGATSDAHSGQTSSFVAINYLGSIRSWDGRWLQAATIIAERPIPRTVVRGCPERPADGRS